MTPSAALDARVRELASDATADAAGLALVSTLLERAETLPASGRDRLLARAEALLTSYQTRIVLPSPPKLPGRDDRAWREALDARVRKRAPRVRTDPRATSVIAEIRASTATARAADQVSASAGPYNGAAVASRTLDELVALAPGYVSAYVAWLEDLASLAELPERRRRK